MLEWKKKKTLFFFLCLGRLCPALKAVFEHGLKKSTIMGGHCHPWLFIEEVCFHPTSVVSLLTVTAFLVVFTVLPVHISLSVLLFVSMFVSASDCLCLLVTILFLLVTDSLLVRALDS